MNPKKPRNNCLNCNQECSRHRDIYCSIRCQHEYRIKDSISKGTASFRTLKKYLLKTEKYCSVCKLCTWNDMPITLELDHIDGDSSNDILSNVRLICPNCHSQTANYKSKNRGKGRQTRRLRYQTGKSW